MIKVVDGCFAYPKGSQILDHICFELDDGKIMTILGQNGIGKTTLIKCLTGILKWTDGYTMIDGKKIHNIREINGLGYVPQAHPLSFSYTVRQIITMGRTRYVGTFSVPSAKDREAVEHALMMSDKTLLLGDQKSSPSKVRVTPWLVRLKICIPSSASVSLTALEIADWVIKSDFAALEMEWQRAISMMYLKF